MAIDITQDIGNGVGDVTPVVENARRLMKLEMDIIQLTDAINQKKKEYEALATEQLPELMDSVGVTGLDLANGYRLELKPVFRASLPAKSTIENADDEERPQLLRRLKDGLTWLRKHKAADLVKNTLRIDLGKGQDAAAKEFAALAKRLKVTIDRSETVHPGSLSKFLKEKMETGAEVPFDTFGVFSGRKAEIKAPKKGKEKTTNE